jgi:hypothetical protein
MADWSFGEVDVTFKREADRRSVLRGAAALGLIGAVGAVGYRRWEDAQALAQPPGTIVDLMNIALTTETLLAAAYGWALNQTFLAPRDREVLEAAERNQQVYCDTYREVIRSFGGEPVEEPEFHSTPAILESRESALRELQRLENLMIGTWQGQMGVITNTELVARLRPILMNKGAHAGALTVLLGDAPAFPSTIEQPITLEQTLSAMEEFREGSS